MTVTRTLEAMAAADSPQTEQEESVRAEPNLLEQALRRAGSDAAVYVPVRLVPAFTSLITTRVFTEAIGRADYGAFYLVSATASFLAAIAVNWLQSSSIRFFWPSKREGRIDNYLASIVWTALLTLTGTAVVTGFAAWLARDSIDHLVMRLIPVALVYFIANFYTTALLQILRAAKRARAFARLQVATTIVVTVASLGFVWVGRWGSAGILAGAAIGNLILAPFIVRSLQEEGSLSPRHIDAGMLRQLVSYGLPLVPGGLAVWALVLLDRFVLGLFRGPSEVGLYSVAYGLGDKIMQLVTMPLLLTMMPSLVETYEKQGERLAERVQTHFTRYFAILTFPLLAGLGAASPVFMAVFTGPAYRSAYGVLALVAAGSMISSFAQVASAGLGLHKRTTIIMIDSLIAAALNVGLNVLLIPRYGYMACAWNTLFSYAFLLALTWIQSRRFMRWVVPWAALTRVAAAALCMAAVVYAMTANLPFGLALLAAQFFVGVCVYASLLVVFKGIRREEMLFMRQHANRILRRRPRR